MVLPEIHLYFSGLPDFQGFRLVGFLKVLPRHCEGVAHSGSAWLLAGTSNTFSLDILEVRCWVFLGTYATIFEVCPLRVVSGNSMICPLASRLFKTSPNI